VRARRRAAWAGPALALLAAARAAAQVPTTALPELPVSPRFAGLGGASAAMIGYAGSVFTNPAGLAAVRVMSLEGAYARPSDSSSYFMTAAGVRLGPANLGGGVRYLRFDDRVGREADLEAAVAVVTRIQGVALGAAANYFSVEGASGAAARTLTADAALTVAVFDIAALAVSVQNIGRTSPGRPGLAVPSSVTLGFSLNLIDTYSNGRLLATVERVWNDGRGGARVGLEAGVVFYGVGLMARAGTGPALNDGFRRGGLGATLVLGRAAIDYAYRARIAAGALHLVGLRLTL